MSSAPDMRAKRKNEGSVFPRLVSSTDFVGPHECASSESRALFFFSFFREKDTRTFRPRGWLARNSAGCFALISLRDKCNRMKDAGCNLGVNNMKRYANKIMRNFNDLIL